MNPIEVMVRHDAELDALGYFQYMWERNPEAAVRFLAALDLTVDGLALQPLKGRLRRFRGKDLKEIRSWRVDGFEHYLIFYRFCHQRLEILRVKNGAMKFPEAFERQ